MSDLGSIGVELSPISNQSVGVWDLSAGLSFNVADAEFVPILTPSQLQLIVGTLPGMEAPPGVAQYDASAIGYINGATRVGSAYGPAIVRLYSVESGQMLKAIESNASGAFSFDNLVVGQKYLVTVVDPNNTLDCISHIQEASSD